MGGKNRSGKDGSVGEMMKKEKVIGIGALLGIIILAVIVVVVAGNQRKNKTKTETENKTETETQIEPDSESESETETAPADKESLDAEELVEENFHQAGITEYEKINLADYESQAGIDLSEYVSYRFYYDSDGLKIEGYFSAPKDLLDGQKTSCLIYNHGGNQDYGALENIETCFYAYQLHTICIASNYRGCGNSEGEDQFGGADVDDVTRLLDLCEQFSYIDKDAINMMGISRGGMMTYEVLRRDERVHKAVIISGLSDCFMSYAERSDMQTIFDSLVGSSPEKMPEEYEKRSATYWADEINTPLLIIHATGDEKVSIAQADKITEALEQAGKTYEYITFDGNSHGEIRPEDGEKIKAFLEGQEQEEDSGKNNVK